MEKYFENIQLRSKMQTNGEHEEQPISINDNKHGELEESREILDESPDIPKCRFQTSQNLLRLGVPLEYDNPPTYLTDYG